MTKEIDLQAVLATGFESSDLGQTTVREYFKTLLVALWNEEEGFSGKRPFGNSGWQNDLVKPLIRAGMIAGSIDPEGYAEAKDSGEFNEAVVKLIEAL